jgi:hypothetical protein
MANYPPLCSAAEIFDPDVPTADECDRRSRRGPIGSPPIPNHQPIPQTTVGFDHSRVMTRGRVISDQAPICRERRVVDVAQPNPRAGAIRIHDDETWARADIAALTDDEDDPPVASRLGLRVQIFGREDQREKRHDDGQPTPHVLKGYRACAATMGAQPWHGTDRGKTKGSSARISGLRPVSQFRLRDRPVTRTILGVTEIVRRDELQAVIEARAELGADMEPAVIDTFVERIERRIAESAAERANELKRKREHQKEMVLGAMGISIPLLAIAAIFTGLAGVIVVCGALAVIAYVSTR